MNISTIVKNQHDYFQSGETKNLHFRRKALCDLYEAIKSNEKKLSESLYKDLGKSEFEGYMCEIALTLSEITYMKRHLKKFAHSERASIPIAHFPSWGRIYKEPYGVTLIMSPWNYPVLLALEPLVDAIAAGNTAVVKPSAYSPNTSRVISDIISETFPQKYISVLLGGREENKAVLDEKFDYIFFTGGTTVGKTVMQKAAESFTPITLEMGGKSPCIVDKTANLKAAARRIAFGKFLNVGQTCVAPDYILIDEAVKEKFLEYFLHEINVMYTASPLDNPSYGRIVNEKHFDRLMELIDKKKVILGGVGDRATLKIAPTVMDNVTEEDDVMQEEIFGPIMPLISYKSLDEAIDFVKNRPHPLALYHFSSNNENVKKIRSQISFGGGCVNDTVIHLASPTMPFGGVGNSGMGSYHGKRGFDTFSHEKSILRKSVLCDLPLRYQPYSKINEKLVRLFLR